MIRATFYKEEELFKGFEIKGHSGYADEGEDIICASVSSAAYMAANTVTDIIKAEADITVDDGYMKFSVDGDDDFIQVVLKGLFLHVNTLADDYSDYIVCRTKTV